MNSKITILWRLAVLGLFAASVPLGIYAIDRYNQIDTDKMLDVSVSIRSMSHVTVDKYGDSVWETSTGSGFLVSTDTCEVWTNHHVIADAAVIEVFPREWNRANGIPATVTNTTPRSDIAVLKLDDCTNIPQAILGDSDLVRPGDETFAVGNPLGRNPDSITRGIISHTHRYRTGGIAYLQTDAAINPGNSGGALFDRNGLVIGINTVIDTLPNGTDFGAGNVGVGFALPINFSRQVVAELHRGPPSWGDAGFAEIVSPLSPEEAEIFHVPDGNAALVVTTTPAEGPSVGKLFVHDVIYRINNNGVTDLREAVSMIGKHRVGETLVLDLIRAGTRENVEITLGEGRQAIQARAPDSYDGYLGMQLEMWDSMEDDRGQFKKPVITKVHSLGPAHKAHIASSQKSVMIQGSFFVPYLLDVKTVTGIAYQGEYHAVDTVASLEKFAEQAYRAGLPMLLEIELWRRSDSRAATASMELAGTAFFKLEPELASVSTTEPELLRDAKKSESVSSYRVAKR